MSDRELGRLTEEQAAHLWQRAAALQAEAARAAESADDEADTTALVPHEGYELDHVRSAAIEAGIGAEFLDAALADMRAEVATRPAKPKGAFVRFFLGEDMPDSVTVRRVVRAPPVDVLKSMEELVPKEPYKLSLKDRKGDPLNGGVLIFDIMGVSFVVTEGAGFTTQAATADLREVVVSLRPLQEGAACEVTLRGPVAWAQRINAALGSVMVGIGTGAGTGLGWLAGSVVSGALLGTGVGAGVAAAAAAVSTAGVVLTSGVASMKGFRWIYRYSLRQGEKGLDQLVGAIAVHAQGGWGLTNTDDSTGNTPPSLPASDADSSESLLSPGD